MSNPFYADKETRKRLSDKSAVCFGTRSKWQWLMNRHGISVVSMEEQMDAIIQYREEQANVIRSNHRPDTEESATEEVSNETRSGETEPSSDAGGGTE